MSAAFSSRTSGVFNYLPEFDKRTSKGILFTNFHANYSLTEGGVVSTLSGVAPIPFPGAKRRDLYDSFGLARSIPESLKNLGYETEFIINTKPNFLQKEAYLRKIGFDRVITERDVPEFKKAERFAFNASSDAVLFNYVLGRIEATKDAQNPRFFGTLTISSHPPYRDPEKIADTRENVWKFVDLQLAHVIDRLEGDGFFKRGILIVLADHREPGPVSKADAPAAVVRPKAADGAKVAAAPPQKIAPALPARPVKPVAKKAAAGEQDRRGFLEMAVGSFMALGFTALSVTGGLFTLGLARFMFPNVLAEPPSRFKVGSKEGFPTGKVETKYVAQYGVWVVNGEFLGQQQIYALKTVCTHLGCTPNWLEAEQKFKCPCHGSGFYKDGVNFEGPAPRPLERYAIKLADDGQLEVDKSRTFHEELGQWLEPDSYITA